jgi:CheY-like chemotaxis protein
MDAVEPPFHLLPGQTILLVEDNDDEVFMMQRACRKANIQNPLRVVGNGEEAIDYLDGTGSFADRIHFPLPTVLFLDLNMPKKSGLEVLHYIRQHPIFRKLTVNILTSSTRPADLEQAAFLGANAYLIKPAQIEKFQELILAWYNLARYQAFSPID